MLSANVCEHLLKLIGESYISGKNVGQLDLLDIGLFNYWPINENLKRCFQIKCWENDLKADATGC